MADHIIIVDDPARFDFPGPGRRVLSARDYIARTKRLPKRARLINLCGDTRYLGLGYYCSLMAEARGERMLPSADAMLWVGWKRIYARALGDLDAALRKALNRVKGEPPASPLLICFGECDDPSLAALGRAAFDAFRCPILSIRFTAEAGGRVLDVDAPKLKKLDESGRALFGRALDRYTRRARPTPHAVSPPRYALAVLHDPKEAMPPSNTRALERLAKAGQALSVRVELITRKDLPRLAEYDALFIRETTNLDHHTYRFAKRAEAEGMPCIDDATSILRCCNKVYLAELFRTNGVPAPRTLVLDRATLGRAASEIGFPLVLKIPDSSFSRGVKKARTPEELETIGRAMLKESDLILAQEYVVTEYDWRIGVLNGAPLYASKYFMAAGHWQIVKHEADGGHDEGLFETVPIEDAPGDIVDAALTAARPIGAGLYGVDVKQTARGPMVVEVNDNPNLDAGVEDKVLKDALWRAILNEFVRRIEAR